MHANFFSLSCDEVTGCDIQSYIAMTTYIVKDWECLPLLMIFEKVQDGATLEAITKTIHNVVVSMGVL